MRLNIGYIIIYLKWNSYYLKALILETKCFILIIDDVLKSKMFRNKVYWWLNNGLNQILLFDLLFITKKKIGIFM
jgi:hypothetical protein